MDDNIVDKVAHALYGRGVVIDMWEKEQEHVKFPYYDAARKLLEKMDSLGICVVEKPADPKPKAKKRKEPKKKVEKGIVTANDAPKVYSTDAIPKQTLDDEE